MVELGEDEALNLDTEYFKRLAEHYDASDERHTCGCLSHFVSMLESDLEESRADEAQIHQEIAWLNAYMDKYGDIYAVLDLVEDDEVLSENSLVYDSTVF